MNLKLWRLVERFCRGKVFDPAAWGAFAQLVEEDQEEAIRKKVGSWNDEELEQLSFLISGTLDTIDNRQNPNGVLQCQGLYITGLQASLLALGNRELPKGIRVAMAKSVSESLPDQARIIIGSHIVPATWVHGFSWKQWRAALARDGAMFNRPCKAQPRQAPESQAWILPVFVEKGLCIVDLQAADSQTVLGLPGKELATALTRALQKMYRSLPADVAIHPIVAAAHSCWGNAKMIAVYEWAKAIQTKAQEEGRTVLIDEAPRRGSVRVRDAQTGENVAVLDAEASFPVDGTRMAIELLRDSGAAV